MRLREVNQHEILKSKKQVNSRPFHFQPKVKINLTSIYSIKKWEVTLRNVYFGQTKFVNNVDPNSKKVDGTPWNDILPDIDQTFKPKIITDLNINYRIHRGIRIGVGANNLFDVYPDRVFIDSRNDIQAVYNNPIAGANQTPGGYSAGRDASNRGRFLYNANQFGFNGRYLYARAAVEFGELLQKRPKKEVIIQAPIVEPVKDRDGDGIVDSLDACPDQPGPARHCTDFQRWNGSPNSGPGARWRQPRYCRLKPQW